jgi:DNA-binding XRE family transcriptional regulator
MTLILEGCQLLKWLGISGLSKAKFADKMDVSRATVTDWCNNKQLMTLLHALKAAHILSCSVHDLYPTNFTDAE